MSQFYTALRSSLPVSKCTDLVTSKIWDVVIVGGGHNGLTAAAYMARSGVSVLVLERRDVLGGACTLERPFLSAPDVVLSPCAYVEGLLDKTVAKELNLASYGIETTVANPGLFCPFPDGTALYDYYDEDKTEECLESLGVSDSDIEGYFAYEELFAEAKQRMRAGARDAWQAPAPSDDELRALLQHNAEMCDIVLGASIASVVRRYVTDERLQTALWGQGGRCIRWTRVTGHGVIRLLHMGDWGYVRGGWGRSRRAWLSARDARSDCDAGGGRYITPPSGADQLATVRVQQPRRRW